MGEEYAPINSRECAKVSRCVEDRHTLALAFGLALAAAAFAAFFGDSSSESESSEVEACGRWRKPRCECDPVGFARLLC